MEETTPSTQPAPQVEVPAQKPNMVVPIVTTAVIALLIGGAGGYAYVHNQKVQSETSLKAQISTLQATATPTPTATATATASPAATATPATSANLKLTSSFGFSFEYPKTWTFSRFESGEGLPHVAYTALTANKTETGVSDQQMTTISAITYPGDAADATLDERVKGYQVTPQHVTDVTVGTGKYAAKRFDDGGGLYGVTVHYEIMGTLKNGVKMFVGVEYIADKASDIPTEIQHLLDTLTI